MITLKIFNKIKNNAILLQYSFILINQGDCMKLIMKTDFELLQNDNKNSYSVDSIGQKETLKLFRGEKLIAKKIKHKKSIRYFGVKGYQAYLAA